MSNLMDKKILITGSAGFIGSHLCEELINQGAIVKGFDNLCTGYNLIPKYIMNHPNFTFMEGDVRNTSDLIRAIQSMNGVDYIVHLGALVNVADSIKRRLDYYDTNTKGTLNLLIVAKELKVEKVIFASTSSVYGNSEKALQTETDFLTALNPYADSKLLAEGLCKVCSHCYRWNITILRFFNVYGERQLITGEGAVVPLFINKLLKKEQPIIHGNGEQRRDFIYVKDVANAIARSLKSPYCMTVNVGSGISTTINSLLIKMVNKVMPFPKYWKPIHTERRPGDVDNSCANISLAQQMLNWNPKYSLTEGLGRTIKWYAETLTKEE